ncbi:YjcZ family sporulation protein [Geomicrobium sp. JCM 19039]|nr:YjcZ family sporulation protein [Geomicrobium sp. JCM 19039]
MSDCCHQGGNQGLGGFAFVVVLFILLVIVGSAYC